jgi:prepilin peptidase CpaA
MQNINLTQFLLLVFPIYLIIGAIFDVLTLKIPNNYILIGLFLFVPIAVFAGFTFNDMLFNLLVGIAILLISFGAYAAGVFGGGDSKFMAVIALWIGFEPLPEFLLYTGIIGGVMALGVLIGGRFVPVYLQPAFFKTMHQRRVVPYGTAMSLATLLVYQDTAIWKFFMS